MAGKGKKRAHPSWPQPSGPHFFLVWASTLWGLTVRLKRHWPELDFVKSVVVAPGDSGLRNWAI